MLTKNKTRKCDRDCLYVWGAGVERGRLNTDNHEKSF